MGLSRRSLQLAASLPVFICAAPLWAQADLERQRAEPPERIDILVDTAPAGNEYEDCADDQDAATITGEIVVCRNRTGDENRLYDKDEAVRRHAERTMGHNEIPPPDVAGAGIFRGPATISGLCFIPPCPEPPAYMIDFDQLPDTPEGSDADRIARGLAPRDPDALADKGIEEDISEEELGLPPSLAEREKQEKASGADRQEDGQPSNEQGN